MMFVCCNLRASCIQAVTAFSMDQVDFLNEANPSETWKFEADQGLFWTKQLQMDLKWSCY